jgi:hypothetical protein
MEPSGDLDAGGGAEVKLGDAHLAPNVPSDEA